MLQVDTLVAAGRQVTNSIAFDTDRWGELRTVKPPSCPGGSLSVNGADAEASATGLVQVVRKKAVRSADINDKNGSGSPKQWATDHDEVLQAGRL